IFTSSFFFFNDTATTEIYTLSLHDALPIGPSCRSPLPSSGSGSSTNSSRGRSEEHTSELQSLRHLVCRLLLEKKNNGKAKLPEHGHSLDTGRDESISIGA